MSLRIATAWMSLGLAFTFGCGDGDDDKSDATGATDTTVAPDTETDTAQPTDTTTAPTDTTTTATDTTVAETAETADTTIDVPWTPVTYTFPTCGTATAADLAGCVDPAKLTTTLGAIAGSRFPGEAKWQAAQDLCATTLADLGFTVTLQPTPLGMNVIGEKAGATKPAEKVIVGAHYDGVKGCDAADDNGSGVAGTLEAARVLASTTHARTLVVACWDVEELGLVGSKIHAASVAPTEIVAVYNFEMIGYTDDTAGSQELPLGFSVLFPEAGAALAALGGRGVFIALIAGDDANGPIGALNAAAATIGLPVVPVVIERGLIGNSALADLHRSDHAPFWARGIPAIQLTDTANFRNPNYHCPSGNSDTVASLDMDFMRAVVAATVVAAKTTLDALDPGTTPVPREPECDVVAQDCGAGKRCTFTATPSGASARSCIDAAANPVGAGAACEREAPGVDTCSSGEYCAFYGGVRTNDDVAAPTFQRYCSPLCVTDSDCAEGASCLGLGGSLLEPTGICRARCDDAFGDACGTGQKCANLGIVLGNISVLSCMPTGPVAAGDACTASSDCGLGHGCFSAGATGGALTCRPYCDATNPCAEGTTCVPLVMLDTELGLGVCRDD